MFSFSCTQYPIYLVANPWNALILGTFCWCCIHLYLRVLVLVTRSPKNINTGILRRFSPPLSLSLSLSLSTLWVFRFGNDNYHYRYHYRLILPKRFWFRYPTLVVKLSLGRRLVFYQQPNGLLIVNINNNASTLNTDPQYR